MNRAYTKAEKILLIIILSASAGLFLGPLLIVLVRLALGWEK